MTDSIESKNERNRERRRQQIREWTAYVGTHPDEEWGRQVDRVVDAQLQSARRFEDERPDLDAFGDSSPSE